MRLILSVELIAFVVVIFTSILCRETRVFEFEDS